MNLEYAMRDGKLLHISEVERGLKCNCICPGCSAPLIARKGKVMSNYFAHQNTECEYGAETMLHIMAKSILDKEKKVLFPDVNIEFGRSRKKLVSGPMLIEFDKVILEKRLGNVVPDVIIRTGERFVIIEILVTHKVDEEKLQKIKDAKLSALEIGLSKLDREPSLESLRSILLDEIANKHWVYNVVAESYKIKWLSICEQKRTFYRGYAHHVDMCPIHARMYRGRPYANVTDDCSGCEFCLGLIRENADDDTYILYCCGATNVRTIQDLKSFLKRQYHSQSQKTEFIEKAKSGHKN